MWLLYETWEECEMAEKKAPVAAVKAEVKKTSTNAVKTTEEPKQTVATKEPTKETAEPVKESAKDTVKENKKAPARKAPAAKKAPAKKTVSRKTASKKEAAKKEPSTSLILQFGGKELASADLFARVKEIWTAELGRDAGDLKDVKLYVKPEETTAYYVINENITGSFEL